MGLAPDELSFLTASSGFFNLSSVNFDALMTRECGCRLKNGVDRAAVNEAVRTRNDD
jgi:hypothetical protein